MNIDGFSAPSSNDTGKRKAQDLAHDEHGNTETEHGDIESEEQVPKRQRTLEEGHDRTADPDDGTTEQQTDKPVSKNQLKKQRRAKEKEAFREDRKVKRKETRKAKKAEKREEREAALAAGLVPDRPKKAQELHDTVPVAFIIDCDFEKYMYEGELKSLGIQLERSYSENRKARYGAHLFVSSWGGKLKERYKTVQNGVYENWKSIHFVQEDFLEAARMAHELMAGKDGGVMTKLLEPAEKTGGDTQGQTDSKPVADDEADVQPSIVYLTSDSPHTLDRLEANTSYVIGGLVDRNREKYLCYKKAQAQKVRTAKLPIGEFMAMQSRHVLTTNQVVEIMVTWLECGDWGKAFLSVIPKRKGGRLKETERGASDDGDGGDGEEDNAEEADGQVGDSEETV